MRRITITDQNTDQAKTVDYMDVADVLDEWNPGAPPEVWDAITSLQDAINRHEPTSGLEDYLGIRLTSA